MSKDFPGIGNGDGMVHINIDLNENVLSLKRHIQDSTGIFEWLQRLIVFQQRGPYELDDNLLILRILQGNFHVTCYRSQSDCVLVIVGNLSTGVDIELQDTVSLHLSSLSLSFSRSRSRSFLLVLSLSLALNISVSLSLFVYVSLSLFFFFQKYNLFTLLAPACGAESQYIALQSTKLRNVCSPHARSHAIKANTGS